MEILKMLGAGIGILNFLGTVIVIIAGYLAFKKIVTNDLHHISQGLERIEKTQNKHTDSICELREDVAYLKGKDSVKK